MVKNKKEEECKNCDGSGKVEFDSYTFLILLQNLKHQLENVKDVMEQEKIVLDFSYGIL